MKTEDELIDNADDSSDEEDEGVVLNAADVLKKWEEFKSDKFFLDIKSLVEDCGSFLRNFFFVLYLGVGLLRSPSVQKFYRNYKKQHLSSNYLGTSEISFKNAVREAIEKSVFQIFRIEGFKQNDFIEKILKKFIEDNRDLFDKIVTELTANQRQLFRGTHISSVLQENFKTLSILRQILLVAIIKETVDSYQLSQNRTKLIYNGTHKIVNDCITNEIIRYINELVSEAHAHVSYQPNLLALHEYLKNIKRAESENEDDGAESSGKEDEGPNEEAEEFYDKDLQWEVLKKLDSIVDELTQNVIGTDDDPRVSLTIQEFVEQNKKDLLIAKFKDIEGQEEYDSSLKTCLWQLVNNPIIREEARVQLKKYLAWSPERIKACLLKNLNNDYYSIIAENLYWKIGSKIKRSFLPRNHIFSSTNEISFLSNLRASNRSQRRMLRHLVATEQGGGDIIRLKWLLANTLTYENQEINENFARIDLVTPIGAYPSIFKQIDGIKSNINCDDAYLAKMIRDILSGKPKVFKDFACDHEKKSEYELCMVSLTYLLFGTEVARNPASLILHQMMLDLIIADKMGWKEALSNKENLPYGGGGYMPMSMDQEPVASARWLNKIFNDYLPRLYHYPGKPQSLDAAGLSSIKELLRRTTYLLNLWKEYERERLKGNHILSGKNIVDSLINRIKSDWFKNISAPLQEEPDEIVIKTRK